MDDTAGQSPRAVPTKLSWIQRSSVQAKQTLVTLVFVAVIAIAFGVLEMSLKISNSVRGYVRGEGLWARGQKDAAIALERYGHFRNEADYRHAMSRLEVNFGDHRARLAMEKPELDYQAAFDGLVAGQNHPDDIPDMIFLFRNFGFVSYLAEAIQIWRDADVVLDQIVKDAAALHEAVQRGATDEELKPLLDQLKADNDAAAILETNFSATLSEGARFVHTMLRYGSAMLLLILLALGVLVARRIGVQLRGGIRALQHGTARVAVGDLGGRIEVNTDDELGQLARDFNAMIEQRREAAATLDQRLAFETLITRLSSGITTLTSVQVDEGINRALGDLGRFAQVDRSYVFVFDDALSRVSCTHEWCAPGVTPQIGGLQNLRVADFPWVEAKILRGEIVHVPRVAELPEDAAAEKREWQRESIRSILLIPMRSGDAVRGYVGFDSVRSDKSWPQEANDVLKIFGEIVANTLARVKAEHALQERNESLAATVQELERSNAELEEFAYVASHDLKTPLRGINGFVQLLRKRLGDKLDAQSKEYIEMTLSSVDQLQNLISGLLELSRVGKGRLAAPTDANRVLAGVEAQLAPIIAERKAEITHDPLPTVMAAPLELHQLLQNLIGNAIKFQPGGNPYVHVSAVREGDFWKFSVRDNGIGISPEHQARIFQLFQRLNPVEKYEGSGIGLTICRKIVQGHGGKIWVESEAGAGATFYFTLPA